MAKVKVVSKKKTTSSPVARPKKASSTKKAQREGKEAMKQRMVDMGY